MNKIDHLFNKIATIPGVGPKMAPKLEKLVGGDQVIDFLFFRPHHILNRKFSPNHLNAFDKELIITKVTVDSHQEGYKSSPFKVNCSNDAGDLTLIFFKTFPGYIENNFKIGSKIVVSGKIDFFNGSACMAHPDFVFEESLARRIPEHEVIYPLTAGVTLKFLRKIMFSTLNVIPETTEWIDKNLFLQNKWPTFKKALTNIHYPKKIEDLEPRDINIKRLAYDELLAESLANQIARRKSSLDRGVKNKAKGELVKKIIKQLPFQLTKGQEKSVEQIFSDMRSTKKMLRLLQGDVGSGKTIVAFLASILAVEDGKQAAIVAPISLLANQHFENLQILLASFDVNIALLTSRTTKSQKKKLLADLNNGKINIVIGTHALIYDDIIFKNLGLIVIDEQHRFGVLQRLQLVKKGVAPDVLLMSATPIPRSLMLTLYGDMDISILSEKPKNRIQIDTIVKAMSKMDEVHSAIARAVENHEKIYWICPLIEENIELDLSNVLEKFAFFKKQFGEEKVALIHGKLKGKEKDEIMSSFAKPDSKIQILIATTVIEVGIDVKDATIIVIENSEKFGLSQLHQLRGRVGRGDKRSYCLLLYKNSIGSTSQKRLSVMRDCFDGFKIAEEDLKMRGSGEVFGTKQSGLPAHKFANLLMHQDLLKIANKNASIILNKSPNLKGEDGENVKNLLRIFKYDHFIKLIQSG